MSTIMSEEAPPESAPKASGRISGIFYVPLARLLRGRVALATEFQRSENVEAFANGLVRSTLREIFHCTNCAVLLVNEAQDRLNQVANTESTNATWHFKGRGVLGTIWQLARAVRLEASSPSSDPSSGEAPPPAPDGASVDGAIGQVASERSPAASDCHLLGFPLTDGARVVGVVTLTRPPGDTPFTVEDESLAEELQSEVGHLFGRRSASDRERQFSHALSRLGEVLQQENDERMALRLLLAAVTCGKGLACNRAALWLSDVNGAELLPELAVGFDTGEEIHKVWENIANLSLDGLLSDTEERSEGALPLLFQGTALRLSEKSQDLLSTVYFKTREGGIFRSTDVFVDEELVAAHDPIEGIAESVFALIPVPGDTDGHQGVLYVDNAFDRKPLDQRLLEMLHKFVRLGGLALSRIREARWRGERAATHERLTAAIVAKAEGKTRVDGVFDALQERFPFGRWLLYYHDPKTRLAHVLGMRGFDTGLTGMLTFDTGVATGALTPYVVREKKKYYFTPASEVDPLISERWRDTLKLRGPVLVLPISANESVYGVLVINDANLGENQQERVRHFENDLATAVSMEVLERDLQQRNNLLELIQKTQTSFVHAFADENWFLHELAFRLKDITNSSLCAIYRTSPRGTPDAPVYRRVVALGYAQPEDEDDRVPSTGDGKGLTNHALCGETIVSDYVRSDPRWRGLQKDEIEQALGPHRTFLGVPLGNRQTGAKPATVGAIVLTRKRYSDTDGLAFQPSDRKLVEAVATGVASYLALKDAWHDRDRRVTALEGLRSFVKEMLPLTYEPHTDGPSLFDALAEHALTAFFADVVVVCPYVASSTADLPPLGCRGNRGHKSALHALRNSPAVHALAKQSKAVYESNVGKLEAQRTADASSIVEPILSQGEGIIAFAALPLIKPAYAKCTDGENVLGMLFIEYRTPHVFRDSEKLIMEAFASYAALAIHSAVTIQEIGQAREKAFEFVFGAVAHALTNVLVTIPGAIDLAANLIRGQGLEPARVLEELTVARENAQRAERVLVDYRSLSRGDTSLALDITTSHALMNKLSQIVRARASEARAEITIEALLVSRKLRANLDHLGDDFRNFVKDSARHVGRERRLRLSLCCDEVAPRAFEFLGDRPYLRITYTDNGPGILAENKERVFDRFFSTSRPPIAMGVGLALARWHADQHDGKIRECGEPGAGVRFELYLPIIVD